MQVEVLRTARLVDAAIVMNPIIVVMTSSLGSRLALHEAIKLATETGARIRLIRIVGVSRSGHELARARAWLERASRLVPEALRGGENVLVGAPGKAVQRAVERYAADTVIVGAHIYGALMRMGVDEDFGEVVGPRLLIVRPNVEPATGEAVSTGRVTHHRHPLLGAVTLTAATTGAVAGAIAGPPGVIAGAAIGGAIGLLAGSVLEEGEDAATLHDHDLDDEIGVTHGSIGLGGLVLPSGPLTTAEER